jgi:hypothetical protein
MVFAVMHDQINRCSLQYQEEKKIKVTANEEENISQCRKGILNFKF